MERGLDRLHDQHGREPLSRPALRAELHAAPRLAVPRRSSSCTTRASSASTTCCFPATVLLETDAYVRDFLVRSGLNGPIVHGRAALRARARICSSASPAARSTRSWPRAAHCGVPIYTSSPGDSSIGMNVAYHELMNEQPADDRSRTATSTRSARSSSPGKKNGCVILGGGSPKNFYLQGQPTLWEVYGIPKGGNDYFIQITTDQVVWGGSVGRDAGRGRQLGQGESRRAARHGRGLRRLDDRVPAVLRIRRGLAERPAHAQGAQCTSATICVSVAQDARPRRPRRSRPDLAQFQTIADIDRDR